jgi:hypothetical protein
MDDLMNNNSVMQAAAMLSGITNLPEYVIGVGLTAKEGIVNKAGTNKYMVLTKDGYFIYQQYLFL